MMFFLLVLFTISFITCDKIEVTICQDKTSPKLVDVVEGSKVQLLCSFCNENDDFLSKLWFYKKRGERNEKELSTNIFDGKKFPKLFTTPTHILVIKEFDSMDSGIYTCRPFKKMEENNFTYILDSIMEFNHSIKTKIVTVNQWYDYKRFVLDSLNEKFNKSKEEPFVTLRDHFRFTFNLVIIWEDQNLLKGSKEIRRKLGKCRLRPIRLNYNESIPVSNYSSYFLNDFNDVSCRSKTLLNFIPAVSEIVRNIPNYEVMDPSYGRALHRVNKNIKKKNIYMPITNQVPENGHIILVCPQNSHDYFIKWSKDKVLLNITLRNNMVDNEDEPHITRDTYNSLHILHITRNEEGIYECFQNDKLIKKWFIKVVSKTKLLNQEFIRYSIYLGFVLSLTITCYCAGVCVAWRRRASFADPLHIYVKKN